MWSSLSPGSSRYSQFLLLIITEYLESLTKCFLEVFYVFGLEVLLPVGEARGETSGRLLLCMLGAVVGP